jgi:phospholipase C
MNRRTWLSRVTKTTGAVLLTQTAACEDDGTGTRAGADGGSDSGGDSGLGDAGTSDVFADSGLSDATSDSGLDAGSDATSDTAGDTRADGSGDAGPGPFPNLRPLRGDGSHPFHYIDTVIILQMENRSFDHYFGSLSLLEGRTDVDGLLAGMGNRTADGMRLVEPVHLDTEFKIDPDPGHGHAASLRQWNNGLNDGFVSDWERLLTPAEYEERLAWVMGYHTRTELGPYYALADAFTLADRWFCALLGPTWPNRYYSHAATSEGQWGNDLPITSVTPYNFALDRDLTVGVYNSSFVHFFPTLQGLPPRRVIKKDVDKFYDDAAAGTLPNIVIVEPDYVLNDDHPPQDVRLGQAFVASIYESLRNSPQWDRCLMLVFYDEHGGFADHVPPPQSQGDERAAEGFDQLGFRVPGMLIGPLVKRGNVFHDVVEHSSVPSLLSKIFDLPQVNERARLSGDFTNAFDLELTLDANRPAPPMLPMTDVRMSHVEWLQQQPFAQPELERFFIQNFGQDSGTYSQRMARTERWLRAVDNLKVARIRS